MVCATADVHLIGLMSLPLLLQNPKLVVLDASGSHGYGTLLWASTSVKHIVDCLT